MSMMNTYIIDNEPTPLCTSVRDRKALHQAPSLLLLHLLSPLKDDTSIMPTLETLTTLNISPPHQNDDKNDLLINIIVSNQSII